MAYGAGGDLAVLLHTAASKCQLSGHSLSTAPCTSGKDLYAGKKSGPVAEMYLFGLTGTPIIIIISFQALGTSAVRTYLFFFFFSFQTV